LPARLGRGARALLIAALAAVVVAVVALASCGGGSEEEAAKLLNQAFDNSIGSATVAIDVEIELEGVQGLEDPIRIKLNGPYQSNGEGKVPSFAWDISGTLGGQSGSLKFTSTGENAFVSLAGQSYEVGEEQIAEANQPADGAQDRSFAQLGLQPREWVEKAETKGEEKVGGVETERVSGTFDVQKFIRDLNEAAGRAGSQFGGAAPAQLTPEQVEQFANSVDDPDFDVYVGKDDDKLRRLSTDVEFDIPEAQRQGLGGATGGSISFTIEFKDIGKRFTIEAPQNPRPISELTEQLQGLGGLGVGGGDGGAGAGGAGGSGGGGGQGASPGTDAFEQYSECLERADPSDTEAIQDCADLLR
jgi:hypothetical protein